MLCVFSSFNKTVSNNTPLSDRSTARFSPNDPGGPGTPIQGPPLLLEGAAIWERYKWPVVGLVSLLILAILGSELYQNSQHRRAEAASAALDGSKTISEYQKVIDQYPGTLAAANAYLLLAREKIDAKDYAGAGDTWQTFVQKFPKHPQVSAALLGRGDALMAQGKFDEARAAYQQVSSAHSTDYTAPLALMAEATLLKSQRKIEDARRVYENLVTAYSNSDVAAQAKEELRYLNALPPVNAPAPTPVPVASVAPAVPVAPVVPAAPTPAASVTPMASPTDAPTVPPASRSTSPKNP